MKKVDRLVALMNKCSNEQIVQALLETKADTMNIVGEVIENVDDDLAVEIFNSTSTYKDKVLFEYLTKIILNSTMAPIITKDRGLMGAILQNIGVDDLAKTAVFYMSKEKTDLLKQKFESYDR